MMKNLNSNGITLAYDSFGEEAAEAILLISGLGTQMIRWADPFCGELAALGYRVIRFDNRDAGRSTSFPQAHVVGRSMGGMIAQMMASEYPSRVLSLTSIMSATGNPALPSAEPDA